MRYRVRLDLAFETSADAQAVSLSEGEDNEEISFCELEICRHDEGLPCTRLDRLEVRQSEVSINEPG